ncbi:CcmD family protein [Halothermothrix orenii]|nr:CcmD family protein [Halothermothrix orenii]
MSYLVIAYGFIWLLILGYIFFINRQQIRLERELEIMEERLKKVKGSNSL